MDGGEGPSSQNIPPDLGAEYTVQPFDDDMSSDDEVSPRTKLHQTKLAEPTRTEPLMTNPLLSKDPLANDSQSTKIAPRLKVYPENTARAGPWVVFFRPKPNGKPLNVMQIAKDLARWPSVTEVKKVIPNKLRVVVTNLKCANEIVASQHFTIEYRVYIPSREVEIEGVVSDESLTVDDIKKHGVGQFKNLISTNVKILDCSQLSSAFIINGQKKYTPSGSFRVTFEGTALPHYVVIGILKLPVRLFVPRPMNCQNCQSMGHTASHCCNKTRCSICGEEHVNGDCTSPVPKCVYCKGAPHDISTCEAFNSCRDKQKRSLKERSKRSYADILKRASPLTQKQQQQSNNVFSAMSVDEGAADTADEGTAFVQVGNSRKRRTATSPQLQRKIPAVTPSVSLPTRKNATDKQKQVPPGFRGNSSAQNSPAFPGASQTPTAPTFSSGSTSQTGLFKLSVIVDYIFMFFNVPDPIRSLVTTMLPIVKTFLQQLMQTWPLLAMIVSIDV